MNVKLTEQEYQQFIIELLSQSVERIGNLRHSSDDNMIDWLYLVECLRTKGIMGDLRQPRLNVSGKSKLAARKVINQFLNINSERNITIQL